MDSGSMLVRKHDVREPAALAHSADVLHDDMALMSYRALRYALLLLLAGFLVAAVAVLATRSIWIDEAMLLRNVYESDIADFLHPLPYYDQASSFLSLAVIKFISGIAETNFVLFRVLIFVFCVICTIPLLFKVQKNYGFGSLLIMILAYGATTYNVLFYMTEIKHYGFEIIGIIIFLYWLVNYLENQQKYTQLRMIWIPVIASTMGFSTILIIPCTILFMIVDFLLRDGGTDSLLTFLKQKRFLFISFLITLIVTYVHMKYITKFQIGNTWSESAYGSKGVRRDAIEFYYIVIEAYTIKFFLVAAVASATSLFVDKNTIVYRINIYFIILVVLVIVLKFTGFYPVIYSRHIAWLLPFNITILVFLLYHVRHSVSIFLRSVCWSILVILLFIIISESFSLARGFTAEHQDNNALYATLARLDASDIIVMGNARPSLEIYQMKIPVLSKHRYFGIMPEGDLSAVNPPESAFVGGRLRNEEFTNWQLSQLPQTRSFLVLISHADPIDHEPPRERIGALRNSLIKNACEYLPIFSAHRVQILKVSCAQPSDDGRSRSSSKIAPSEQYAALFAPERQDRRRRI